MTTDATISESGASLLQSEALLERSEVARVLRVREATIANLDRTGQLRAVQVGRHARWRPRDVVEFIEGLRNGEDRK